MKHLIEEPLIPNRITPIAALYTQSNNYPVIRISVISP